MACATLKRHLELDSVHSRLGVKRARLTSSVNGQVTSATQQKSAPSPFADILPKASSEQIAVRVGQEIRRLHRRRGLYRGSSPPASAGSSPSSSQTALLSASTLTTSSSTSLSRDTPLLTLREVGLVCERMMKEREDQLQEEYNKILGEKLNEQYEAFLKFNHDQLSRRFGESAASYVS